MSNTMVDKVIVKVEGEGKYNKKAGKYNGYIVIKKDEYKDNIGKIFICNDGDKEEATVFERFNTKTPKKTGYFYRVADSEDGEGASLWMDEKTMDGMVYAERRTDQSVLGVTDNVHSWVSGTDSKHRLFACLGTSLSQEALALPRTGTGSHDQDQMSKANGGKQIFCNGKYHRDGLKVTIEIVD